MKLNYDSAILIDPISTNKGITSQGYLVAQNALLARTGIQYYLSQEIGLKDENGRPILNKKIKVYRLPEDVFHPNHLRSLESAPVTDDHPSSPEGVTVDNHHILSKGHGRNIQPSGDNVAGDLVITDPALIRKIQNGEQIEISNGYGCDYEPYKDGLKQVNIIANHIAVVKRGRAGSKVKIYDSQPKGVKPVKNKKELQAAMFAAYCKDASPEDIQTALALMTTDAAEPEIAPAAAQSASNEVGLMAKFFSILNAKPTKDSDEGKEGKEDEDSEKKKTEDKILAALDSIGSRLDKLEKAKTADADGDEDEEEEQTEDEDEEEDGEKSKKTEDTAAALQALAQTFKPLIAKLPEKERKQANDSLRALMGKKPEPAPGKKKVTYGEISKTTFPKTRDSAAKRDEALGDEIYAQYNAQALHAKKV